MEMTREEHALYGTAPNMDQGIRMGAVPREDGYADSQVPCLFGQQGGFRIIVGRIQDLGVGGLHGGQLSGKVLVPRLDIGRGNDLAPVLGELFGKKLPSPTL